MSKLLVSNIPELVKEWDWEKNGNLTPDKVTAGSIKKVAWKCFKGEDHEWKAVIYSRSQGRGCPFCAGRKVSITNSLISLFPGIAKEWHSTKNGNLTSYFIVAGSTKKIWWRCSKNNEHEWEAKIVNRTRNKNACPFCTGRKTSFTNSLAINYPEIIKDWHPTKNNGLNINDISFGCSVTARHGDGTDAR